MGQVMGNVKALCQEGFKVIMIGIQGGPITQMEQVEMAQVRINIIADLTSKNLGLDPDIELDLGLQSYDHFVEKYLSKREHFDSIEVPTHVDARRGKGLCSRHHGPAQC